jgi:ribosomal protein L7/L12
MQQSTELKIIEVVESGYHSGKTIVEVIKTVREQFNLSLGEAKVIVSRQPCWAKTVLAAQPLHDAAVQLVKSTRRTP